MIAQPTLFIPPEIEAGLLDGTLKLTGSVVRWAANGRIHKHLKVIELPTPEAAKSVVERLASGSKKQYAVVIVGTGAVVVTGLYAADRVKKKRAAARAVAAENMPECVKRFEDSLKEYAKAGRVGALDQAVLGQLIVDLDAVKVFMDVGNEVLISLDNMLPLFDYVIAHTPKLAAAYDVELDDDLDAQQVGSDDGVVVSLRRHLEAQRSILSEVA